MSHKHLPWRPSPAAKPTHLTSTTTSPPQSLAALQGAASAFASRPAAVAPNVKNLRKQYEASLTPGAHEKRRGRSPGIHSSTPPANSTPHRSPSRGRHLSPEDAHVAGARSAVSSSASPTPASLDRTSSMIAARLASASPSPVRTSGSTSPPKGAVSAQEPRNAEIGVASTIDDNRSSADQEPAVVQASALNEKAAKPPASTINVDFNHLPTLVPTSPVAIPARREDVTGYAGSPMRSVQQKPVAPAPRMARTISERASRPSDEHSRGSPGTLAQPRPIRHKAPLPPLPPLPRHAKDMARSPLQHSPIPAHQLQGLTREEVINRMADAMVASSLASTRTPSPGKVSRNHTGKRRSVSVHNTYRKPTLDEVKLGKEVKALRPMKQTLRKASPADEDETVEVAKRGRRHLMRKHPNMHHEGDRKRWRDKVTESERKRYEGVFAANRGLLLKAADRRTSPSRLVDPNSESNRVVNVIVRDIWDRSRLPAQALEQIYDLVAPDEPMYLNREQFVVGLWLIDQKLKGRKLPVRVSESVWASVRHSQGIRVSSKTMQ